MSFTEIERSICNKMGYDSSGLLAPAEAGKGAVRNRLSAIRSQLNSYVASPQAVIDAATAQLRNSAGTIFPGSTENDVEKLVDLINNCTYLQTENPISTTKALIGSMFEKLDSFFGDVASVPEYLLGEALGALDELFNNDKPRSSGLTDLMKDADKLINCLSTLCNGEYTSEVIALTNQTQNLYDDLGMVSDPLSANYGLLDKDTLFSDAGLTPSDITKITGANDEVNSLKDQGQQAINDLMDATKTAKKAGDILF